MTDPQPIRCLAIDDEPLALGQIGGYIEKTPFLALAGSARSAFEAMEILAREPVDLLFVDINMPGLNGMDFVKALGGEKMVVFTTAYDQYALEGFRVDAVDYLLKPIGYPDFLRAANKAQAAFAAKNPVPAKEEDGYLFVQSEYRTVRIEFDRIRYIESMSEYVRIHLTEGKPVMSLMSLRSLEEKLPRNRFMRVHRSTIVNLAFVHVVERGRILLDPQTSLSIGDQYKKTFQEFLDKHLL